MRRHLLLLGLVLVLALGLRLLAWQLHARYPLGGDERDYFNQALTFLQGRGYQELPLMRPPGYPVFLAVVFRLFDSQVQRVRLVQALISTVQVAAVWWLAREILRRQMEGASQLLPFVAALLTALSWTLAVNATELLTETLFVFGLTCAFALLLMADRLQSVRLAVGVGLVVGALALVRSVALPLLGLGGAWLLVRGRHWQAWRWRVAAGFVIAGAVVIAPWTLRNIVTYGGLIVVDTTGAENLWLDNAPEGREVVKQQLYALGDDRLGRQRLAMERGVASIVSEPERFLLKMGGEAQKLVALEYFDDMRNRPDIWVPPGEVWLRLILGDGLWVLLVVFGSAGLWLHSDERVRWLFVLWLAYVVLTNLVFHVELRYRLPMYPVLLVYAGWMLVSIWRVQVARRPRMVGALLSVGALCTLLLLHRPYVVEGAMLAQKHWALWRGDGATALALDPASALARVALFRSAPNQGDAQAEALLREAIVVRPHHGYAHLLLGNLERERGNKEAAQELWRRWETWSLEDMQRWSWNSFQTGRPGKVDVGNADLGWIQGFHAQAQGEDDYRWTTGRALVLCPRQPNPALRLRLASGRPPDSPPVPVSIALTMGSPFDRAQVGTVEVGSEWEIFEVPINPQGNMLETLELSSPTFRPRDQDRASDDNRALGIKVDWVEWSGRSSS